MTDETLARPDARGPGLLLAGPILRRAEPGAVCVWIATRKPVDVRLTVYHAGSPNSPVLGEGKADTVALGEHLFVHLLTAIPEQGRFPEDQLLTYDLDLAGSGTADGGLAGLGLTNGPDGLCLPGLKLPSFFLRNSSGPLHLLHGSCRKPHGKGRDAFLCADELLCRTSQDLARRPSALFLTGDQIYADDVAPALGLYLNKLGTELTGQQEAIPGMPPRDTLSADERKQWLHEHAGFTSPHAANHLTTFGEFAAAYLLAFGGALWPQDLERLEADLVDQPNVRLSARDRRRRMGRIRDLNTAREAFPVVRRVLANIPAYMIFDDHDVTDDWNLTKTWRERVYDSDSGRRIVANALAAYWAFQGWGNHPDAFDGQFKKIVEGHLCEQGQTPSQEFDQVLWERHTWSFCAPTRPAVVCLDTRTQRHYDGEEGAARLVGPQELARVGGLIRQAGHTGNGPLVMVSAAPVFGLEMQERRERSVVRTLGPYRIDFEAWHSSLQGVVDLMSFLIDEVGAQTAVMLSGDVHYGMTVDVEFTAGDRSIHIAQLVSSGMKHSGGVTKVLLTLLGKLNRRNHERVGWKSAPQVLKDGTLKKHVLHHAVNTDTWMKDGPVFLSPAKARRLGIKQPPDYREIRKYIRPDGPTGSLLVGENNVGLAILDGPNITHRLLSRGEGTTVHEARLELIPIETAERGPPTSQI